MSSTTARPTSRPTARRTARRTALRRPLAALAGTAVAAGLAVGLGPTADAAPRAKVTVTIKAEGVELSGKVISGRPACYRDRPVRVYRQVGQRGGGDDRFLASDTSDDQGRWNTGNTGVEGRFYARVRATGACKADASPTVRARRNP